ncbi:MAG: glycosyltransferase family 2 protein [Candidatus Daviesbacteria bacterium]|nr:glycosyltransferase family 2 protein [Candidatus Daviesbacteria bacterium]
MTKISVVINTLNEEKNIEQAIRSVNWADEIIVCDMHSDDKTAEIAKKLGAKVILHEREGFVEPARNFAISKASHEWILVLDADELIPDPLATKLQNIASANKFDVIKIPRKNIIFGKWMKASMWWPDYNIRFFKKGMVSWGSEIHRPPKTTGLEDELPATEDTAILHHNYGTVSQFIERMNRYTSIEAEQLRKNGYKFSWKDLVTKPVDEFLSRFFAGHGFEDGVHGLALSMLQAFSFLIVSLKVWEHEKFTEEQISLTDLEHEVKLKGQDINYWFKYGNLSTDFVKSLLQKLRNKIS